MSLQIDYVLPVPTHSAHRTAASQTSRRVWRGFLKSKGYKEVTIVLPEVRAFIVKQWSKESLNELNQDGRTDDDTPPSVS